MSGRNLNKTDSTELQKQTKNEPLYGRVILHKPQHNFLYMQSMVKHMWVVKGYVNFVLRDKNVKKKLFHFRKNECNVYVVRFY